jgi:hypothetical protein
MADEFTPVTLLDPAGTEFVAHSATEVNDLIYGHGYRPKEKGKTVEEITASPAETTRSGKKSE